jgi:hypothetical protein
MTAQGNALGAFGRRERVGRTCVHRAEKWGDYSGASAGVENSGFRPEGPETWQPRATPWGARISAKNPALKGPDIVFDPIMDRSGGLGIQ